MLEAFIVAMLINSSPGSSALIESDIEQKISSAQTYRQSDLAGSTQHIDEDPRAHRWFERRAAAGSRDAASLDLRLSPRSLVRSETANSWNDGTFKRAKERTASATYPQWRWFEQHTQLLALEDRFLNASDKPPLFQNWSPF